MLTSMQSNASGLLRLRFTAMSIPGYISSWGEHKSKTDNS